MRFPKRSPGGEFSAPVPNDLYIMMGRDRTLLPGFIEDQHPGTEPGCPSFERHVLSLGLKLSQLWPMYQNTFILFRTRKRS